ncbi:MAG: type II secretion system protein GspM [Hyphomonas sp.]|nr:type II secretion system protein M [Hyphomonas sp.]MCB9971559.1 type II secretion system protein M [Hyphomonas sp.]
MTNWLGRLTARERILLGSAVVIAAICLVFMIVVPKLKQARSDAEARLTTAIDADERSIIGADGAAYEAGRLVPAALPISQQRQVMIDAAANRGLAVSRLQSPDDSSILFQFEHVSSPALFGWLEDLERLLGQEPVRATVEASESGGVRASVEFHVGATS